MKYVEAEWIPNEEFGGGIIKATGDDGIIYWVPSMETDVPPFPEFLAEGGVVKNMPEPPE